MANYKDIASLSALPIVDLTEIDKPNDGIFLKVNRTCKKNFQKGNQCREHYTNLNKSNLAEPIFAQCPVGFTSLAFSIGPLRCALTAFVPFPRLGGDQERARASQNPETKIPQENVHDVFSGLRHNYQKLTQLYQETIKNESMALHEIRKLNRTVKQTAERLYNTYQTPELLQIWKTSELMSKQFDVIEILANESLAQLTPNATTEIYKILDKCVHIYQTSDDRIKLGCQGGYLPKALVSDKTFPIIPTVLIENALKYSPQGSGIGISIERDNDACLVKVANVVNSDVKFDDSIFQRGVRGQTDAEGSGNGLYVAQLIAKQHGFRISVHCTTDNNGIRRCTFSFRIKTL